MKLLVVLCVVAAVTAAPQSRGDYSPEILRYEYDNAGFGGYKYAFEQSDGTRREEQGEVRNEGLENEYLAVKGSYSYVGNDGVTYSVNYLADENGFQPEIEQGPGGGVPPAVLASLVG